MSRHRHRRSLAWQALKEEAVRQAGASERHLLNYFTATISAIACWLRLWNQRVSELRIKEEERQQLCSLAGTNERGDNIYGRYEMSVMPSWLARNQFSGLAVIKPLSSNVGTDGGSSKHEIRTINISLSKLAT